MDNRLVFLAARDCGWCVVLRFASHETQGGSQAGSYDPMQPHIRIPRKVIRGGSYLCAPNYCQRYRRQRGTPR